MQIYSGCVCNFVLFLKGLQPFKMYVLRFQHVWGSRVGLLWLVFIFQVRYKQNVSGEYIIWSGEGSIDPCIPLWSSFIHYQFSGIFKLLRQVVFAQHQHVQLMMSMLKSSCCLLTDKLYKFVHVDKETFLDKRSTAQHASFLMWTPFSTGLRHFLIIFSTVSCSVSLNYSIKQTVNHLHHVFYVVFFHI